MITFGRLIGARHRPTRRTSLARWALGLAAVAFGGAGVAAPPPEYTTLYAGATCSNSGCHSSPPYMPLTSNIVPVGSATADGAGLRTAMTNGSSQMSTILSSPALTDTVLNTIRLYLVDVRDGGVAVQSGSARCP